MCHRPRLELCNEYWVVNFIETNNSQVDLYFPSFFSAKSSTNSHIVEITSLLVETSKIAPNQNP